MPSTFGYTSIGGAVSIPGMGICFALNGVSEQSPSTGGTITKFSYYAKTADGSTQTVDVAAYAISGGVIGARLAAPVTITINSSTYQWWDSAPVSQAMSVGTTYVIAVGNYSSAQIYDLYDGASTIDYQTVQSLPAIWASSGTASEVHPLYATYTAPTYDIIVKKTAPFNTLKAGLAPSATQSFGLQLLAPTGMTDGAAKTGVVTVVATAA